MRKSLFFFGLLAAVLLPVCAPLASAAPAKKSPPNIVVFLIDDLGWRDLGCFGSTFYETPNIDKLAASGMRFTNSHSAHAVCSPTRASLMTGKQPQRLGILNWIHQPSKIHLPLEETTLGEAFQAAGYTTGYIGKWHLGEKDDQLPDHQGFDWMKCVNHAGQPASYFYPYKKKFKRGTYWDIPDLEDGKKGDYLTDALTDKAIGFIEANKEKPFFLYFAHYAVHAPIHAPKKLVGKYRAKRKKMFGDTKTPKIGPGRYGDTWSRGRQDNPTYAAMIENLDTNIGRVIKKLDALGLADNTIVLFTSDNGGLCELHGMGATCNLPARSGKGWNYEGGIRIPTIFNWKGHIKPGVYHLPIASPDMFPTLLDLAGQPLMPGQHVDGRSLATVLKGAPDKALEDRAFCWSYPFDHGSGHKPSSAIQKGPWKLIHFEQGKPNELYNLDADIGEKKDLSDEHPERTKAMAGELKKWLAETAKPNPKE